MASKKPTMGKKIADDFYEDLLRDIHSHRKLVKAIDAGYRRLLREAFAPSIDASREYRLAERNRVAAKYGVKLRKDHHAE